MGNIIVGQILNYHSGVAMLGKIFYVAFQLIGRNYIFALKIFIL